MEPRHAPLDVSIYWKIGAWAVLVLFAVAIIVGILRMRRPRKGLLLDHELVAPAGGALAMSQRPA